MIRSKGLIIPPLLLVLVALLYFGPVAAQTPTPLPEPAPRVPFAIEAPWPAGIDWEAGGDGAFYGDYLHKNADYFALDFNHPTTNADAGVLVLAVADGIVVDADCDDNGSYGCRVVVAHPLVGGYCYQSQYAHLQRGLLVPDGWAQVAQGQPLGRVGATGLPSGGDHLHLAIHRRPQAECNAGESAFRRDMAVVPEPLAGNEPIEDAIDPDASTITSRTYSVGYEQLTARQIEGFDPLPDPHAVIIEAYQKQGGQFGRFGRALGPVNQLGDNYYQEFAAYDFNPELLWYGEAATIVEHSGSAYSIHAPVWQRYRDEIDRFGIPVASSYAWQRSSDIFVFRTDFDNDLAILSNSNGVIDVIDSEDDTWEMSMWNRPDHFEGAGYRRLDPYLDFVWEDVSRPGPFNTDEGFSASWKTEAGGLLSLYNLVVETQGHVDVFVNGNAVLQIDSPDQVRTEESRQINFLTDEVQVHYWQDGKRPGKLNLMVDNISIIPKVFASEGTIHISSLAIDQLSYAQFTPGQRDGIVARGECPLIEGDGVTLHEHSEDAEAIYIACVDLTDPYLRFEMVMANDILNVNASPDQRETIANIVQREPYAVHNPLLAFNADYFGTGHGPEGFTVKNGLRIDGEFSQDYDGNETARVSQAIGRDNSAAIGFRSAEEVDDPILLLSQFYNATGGGPILIKDGILIPDPCPPEGFSNTDECRRTNQTAVGISEDGRTYMVISAENKTGAEMGQLLLAYSAFNAMKLDGGGSTQLWYDGDMKIESSRGIANAMLVLREEIPRHDAFALHQSRFPVVEPNMPISLTVTLRNTGFLPWHSALPYTLQNVDGNPLGATSSFQLPVDIATNSDVQWTIEATSPPQPGFHETRWQMVYEGIDGDERFGPEIGFVVTVVPVGTPPDLRGAIQNLIDQVQAEIDSQIDQFMAELQRLILAEIEQAIRDAIPPELQCFSPATLLLAVVFVVRRKRR